ncbi:MAG: glycoside hydrolase family 10 protein [Planctomycetota bacterium]
MPVPPVPRPQPPRRARRCAAAALLLTFAAAGTAQEAALPMPPPLPHREFRAAWVATVDNIDWPSRKGLPTAAARAELLALVDEASALGLNALVFQVRPSADAFYRSEREPWSEWLCGAQGQAPQPAWDPLAELLDYAHLQGLEVHAWFNPFRARHPAAKSPDAAEHVLRRMPDACVTYGSYRWMDPGDPRAADWSLAVIADVVARYDVDGIHLDDYFYPYPEKGAPFPDEGSYRGYRQGGGTLARADWRRANIDAFVWRLQRDTHQQKAWVKVGISPFGIARPGVPRGIQAGIDQYEELAADVLGWLQRGEVDYLAPQLYWPIDQEPQSYAVLLPWWCGQNTARRHLWPGLSAGRALAAKAPWRADELGQQIEMTRAQTATSPGHVLFSWRALRAGSPQRDALRAQLRAVYREAAVVPASPWLDEDAPLPQEPRVTLQRDGDRVQALVTCDDRARFWCAQVLVGPRWLTLCVRGARSPGVELPPGCSAVAVRGVAPNGLLGEPAVLPVPR